MVFSRGQDIQHEQEIVSAIRESLLQDPRIALLGGHHQEDNLTVQDKSYRAYGNIVPDPSINPSERQSTAHRRVNRPRPIQSCTKRLFG